MKPTFAAIVSSMLMIACASCRDVPRPAPSPSEKPASVGSATSAKKETSPSASTSSMAAIGEPASSAAKAGLDHAPFRELPTLPNKALASDWANGEPRILKDVTPGKSGELFSFRWDDATTALTLIKSADLGHTWTIVAGSPTNPCTIDCLSFPRKLAAIAQDSTGRVHAIGSGAGTAAAAYLRLELAYQGPSISGFSLATPKPLALPDHKRVGLELRADLKLVKDEKGHETLAYMVNMATVNQLPLVDIHVYMGKATSLTPTSASDLVGLGGEVGDTQVFDSCTYGAHCVGSMDFSNHAHTSLFAQNGSTGDLWLFQGPIDADFGSAGSPASNLLYAIRLRRSPTGWSRASESTFGHAAQGIQSQLLSVASAASRVYVMFLDPVKGMQFGSMSSDGTFTEAAVPSPAAEPERNGWGVFQVSPDGDALWAIWNTLDRTGKKPMAAEGYWNGKQWTLFADPGASDSMGMGGSAGWADGVAAISFTGAIQPQTYLQPRAAAIHGR